MLFRDWDTSKDVAALQVKPSWDISLNLCRLRDAHVTALRAEVLIEQLLLCEGAVLWGLRLSWGKRGGGGRNHEYKQCSITAQGCIIPHAPWRYSHRSRRAWKLCSQPPVPGSPRAVRANPEWPDSDGASISPAFLWMSFSWRNAIPCTGEDTILALTHDILSVGSQVTKIIAPRRLCTPAPGQAEAGVEAGRKPSNSFCFLTDRLVLITLTASNPEGRETAENICQMGVCLA